MHVLYIPGQNEVQHGVQHHHEKHHKQVVLITFHRGDVDVVPLNSHSFYLIEGKVLGTKSEGSRGKTGTVIDVKLR